MSRLAVIKSHESIMDETDGPSQPNPVCGLVPSGPAFFKQAQGISAPRAEW